MIAVLYTNWTIGDWLVSKDDTFKKEDKQPEIEFTKSIFLTGPTPVTEADKSWRKDAVDILNKIGYNGIVYYPEYPDESQYFNQTEEDFKIIHEWEWKAAKECDCICFWIPRDIEHGMPAYITNIEFGLYMGLYSEKIILGYPPNTYGMYYIADLYKNINLVKGEVNNRTENGSIRIYDTLESTMIAAKYIVDNKQV